jgi:hypothetical protein
MENLSFEAQVDAWCRKTDQRMELVFKESTQRLVTEVQTPVGAGGNMPIDTGFLRNTLQASTTAPSPIDPSAVPVKPPGHIAGTVLYQEREGDIAAVIASATLGQTIYLTYTAAYARIQEMKRGFVRLAAQRWPQIVAEVIRDAKDRVAGR